MTLYHKTLPYEIRKTACELFAGRTGFTQDEMKDFFTEEIRKAIPSPPYPPDGSGFWASFNYMMEHIAYDQKLRPGAQRTRAAAFEYWLSLLPLQRQKEILLELCRKPDFPMKRKPSSQRRKQLEVILTEFALDAPVSAALQRLDSTFILQTWEKAMDRCEDDPQGAFTAMRTLLESVCKHLLDMLSIAYGEHDELPRLYFLLAQALQIAPNQQSDPALRQIFGGCNSVVNGLGALRNQLGDAHGQGRTGIVPASYHAKFAVNLAGAVAIFLMQVWEADPRSYNG